MRLASPLLLAAAAALTAVPSALAARRLPEGYRPPVADRADPQFAGVSCEDCKAVAGFIAPLVANSTALNNTITVVDSLCSLESNATLAAACKSISTGFLKAAGWVEKQLETVDWDDPVAFCSVFVPVCTQPCCDTPAEPEQLHLSLGADASSMMITWVTLNATATPVVRWGPASLFPSANSAPATVSTYTQGGWVGTIYTATMTGLQPGNSYSYMVGDASTGTWSSVYSYSTLDATAGRSPATPLTIGQIADTDFSEISDNTIAALTSLAESGGIDMLLLVGDNGYADGFARHDDAFQRKLQPICAIIPCMANPGNHELWYDFKAYQMRWPAPGPVAANSSNMYYSFTYGPALFVQSNTETALDTADIDPAQKAWMQATLQAANMAPARAAQPWVLVTGHRPLYCTNSVKAQCELFTAVLRLEIESLLVDNRVDLVVAGHEHSYERSWPVVSNVPQAHNYTSPAYPVYVIQGAGGNREGNDLPIGNQPWSAFQSSELGFGTLVFAGPHSLTYNFYGSQEWVASGGNATAALLDSFEITK